MTPDSEGFLIRWSRRKRGGALPVEEAPPAPAPALDEPPLAEPPPLPPAEVAAVPETAAAPAAPAQPPLDLPPLDSLTADSDFSVFLRPGVPTGLRHAALRRMWSLDTAIRDFVGPADYAWDYNAVDGVPGASTSFVTANLRSMLAQAVGRTEAQLDAEDAAPAPPAATGEVASEPPGLRTSASWGVDRRERATEPAPTPEEPPAVPAFIPPEIAAEAYPGLRLPPPPLPELPPILPATRRRHGGALPE